MLGNPWIAALFAIFAWWFFTGIILLIVRKADRSKTRNHGLLVALSTPLFAAGVAGLVVSAQAMTVVNVYIAFLSVMLVWGWIELAFLSGVIAGPERRPCPVGLTGWARFERAWHTLSYHELLLLIGVLVVTVATFGAENEVALWSYLILFGARISAKLNLFFGVPRINTEFVPARLQHLKSYFRQGHATPVFGIGISVLSLTTVYLGTLLIGAETAPYIAGFSLLTALAALATLEHWLMVIPLPDAKLWRWMLPSLPVTTKTGQSHEL